MAAEVTTVVGAAMLAAGVIESTFYQAAYDAGVIAPLVKVINMAGQPSDTVKVPKKPKLTAASQTQGQDMANSAYAPTSVNVTAALAGVMITLLDTFLSSDIVGSPDGYATDVGTAVAEKIDTDLAAEFADFAVTVGTSGSPFTAAQMLTAVYEMLNGKAKGQFVAVLHPIQKHHLRTNILAATGAIWGAGRSVDAMLSPMPGMPEIFFNVVCFESTVCASVNTDADRQGAMFPLGDESGIVYAPKWGARVEQQRNASLVGTELVGTAYYGDECANTAANGGVKIVTDHE